MATATAEVRTVEAQVRYLAEGSFVNRRYVSAGIERNTGRYEDHAVKIGDARPIRHEFSLDVHGFTLLDHVSQVADFHDADAVDRLYEDEVKGAVKAATGADHVFVQGWMVRTSADLSRRIGKVEGYQHKGGVQPPAGEAHVDYDVPSAARIAERVYREGCPDGPGYSRAVAFSFWRAFSPPPQDVALALLDGRSLVGDEGASNTLHIVDEIPDAEAMLAPIPDEDAMIAATIFRYRPEHRWWYFSRMTRDEALLFKFNDSDHSVTWRCPHTAFFDPSFPDARIRESIEVRCVAFFD